MEKEIANCVRKIIEYNCELEVVEFLSKSVLVKLSKLENENREFAARIKAIKKLNFEKNEAIEALCDCSEGGKK